MAIQKSIPLSDSTSKSLAPQQVGFVFAETHLHLDCWGAAWLDDETVIENALRSAAKVLDAELLHIHWQSFSPDGRITGVAITPTSQISIRTWPNMGYAAIDIFMGEKINGAAILSIFKSAFLTDDIRESEKLRGRQFADMTPAKPTA